LRPTPVLAKSRIKRKENQIRSGTLKCISRNISFLLRLWACAEVQLTDPGVAAQSRNIKGNDLKRKKKKKRGGRGRVQKKVAIERDHQASI